MNGLKFIRRNLFLVGIYIFVLATLIFTLFPVIWLGLLSLKTQLQAFTYPPLFIFRPTFKHYYEVIVHSNFFRYFSNSMIVSLGSVALSLILAIIFLFSPSFILFSP